MNRRKNKWNCESIKIIKHEIPESEFNEKLERVWELLQSQERQPQKLFRPRFDNELVKDPVQTYRRSA